MKFIKLEILNLASLDRQEGETIDFEGGALGNSTIFSIVGPTGSGKSTILDAICLALYNRAPRYPRKKGEKKQKIEIYGTMDTDENNRPAPTDPSNILTQGKKDGYSKLTFLANDGTYYRAEWHIHKKTKKIADPTLLLYKLSTIDGKPSEEIAEWDQLPQIIGLDYDQFLRTVLIAQGSFSSFLKAKEDERYELLEKLIGCEELYTNISASIRKSKEDAVNKYNQITASLSAYQKDIIPDDELDAINARVKELEEEDKKCKEELQKVTADLNWYKMCETYLSNISKFEKDFNIAEEERKKIKETSALLALHDSTIPAVTLYNEIKTAEANVSKLQDSLSKLATSIEKKKEDIKNEEEVSLKQLMQKAKEAEEQLKNQKPNIEKAKGINAQMTPLQNILNEKKVAYNKAKKEASDARALITDTSIDIATAEENYKIKNQELEQRNEKNRLELETLSTDEIEQSLATLRDARSIITSKDLKSLRQNLEDGKPCPLCGAIHHPYHNEGNYTKVTTELDSIIESKSKELKEVKDKITRLNKELSTDDNLYKLVAMLKLAMDAANKGKKEEECKEEVDSANKDVTEKKNEIHSLIGDKDPAKLENELTTAIDKANKDVAAKNDAIVKMREKLKEWQGQEKTTREQKEHETSLIKDKTTELDEWIESYNGNDQHQDLLTIDVIAQLHSATDNWEAIRQHNKRVEENYTSAKTTLDNEKDTYNKHQANKPEKSKDELETREKELKDYSNTELSDLKARVLRHNIASKQTEDMRSEVESVTSLKNDWSQIYDSIGGDGKTLRKIAQCYTLRFLIEHANAEIRKFNNRYELIQVKNSLGIRVIDHDRTDDIRDTTSLSGGETFIVSLGLALGLSALSSRNISFENLFIDEGFGTLDSEALASVIDSLAMLQMSQGKKVGVISHTETMSERITTQIRIIKNGNNGSSHIEIYP